MISIAKTIRLSTKGEDDIVDITGPVERELASARIENGLVVVFVTGSTAAVTIMEYERGLLKDIPEALGRIAPRDSRYLHSETWHDDNGHSHVRSSIVGPSLSIPVSGGKMTLGRWQQVVLMEFDTRPRTREVVLQIMGE